MTKFLSTSPLASPITRCASDVAEGSAVQVHIRPIEIMAVEEVQHLNAELQVYALMNVETLDQ